MNDEFHLTPIDIRAQEFRRSAWGYDRAHVDDFRGAHNIASLEALVAALAGHATGSEDPDRKSTRLNSSH